MNEKDKELLAGFHHTISEQLNSRLSESPKFFGLLVVVSTGYGYVLSSHALNCNKELFVSASLLSYGAVLWASWYLAALSYGFRFLQNIQHCVEHALKWNPRYVPKEKEGGERTSWFWTLPSIYHPHAVGLGLVLFLICGIFAHHAEHWFWVPCCVWLLSASLLAVGWGLMCWAYRYYLHKFNDKRMPPAECDIYSA
jgi:protein-S-isoprenylcysteine O-methyltransferase Ste14